MQIGINSLNRENWAKIWPRFSRWIQGRDTTHAPARFEWGVIAFASGIAVYFAMPFEPKLLFLGVICALLGALLYILPLQFDKARMIFGVFLLFLGVGRSAWHSQSEAGATLPDYERAYWVTGWVSAVEKSGPRLRWRINVDGIEGLETSQVPRVIRTSAGGQGVRAGDFIRIRSVLSAPPGPVISGGYDPGRRAFFEGLGGTGYAISKAEKIDDILLSWPDKLRRKLIQTRYGLADRVLAAAPDATAGLQVGLLTGIRTYIPKAQTETLRTAGLAHILAISGLHMGLMAGSVYFLAALGLACISPLARRFDIRKPAACIGAVAATAYLLMSGASVATQRAFIMTCIVFLAIILDRRAFSMRSVALAAIITLLWHPEALTGAGFQMSFAAVAALVAVYRAWDARREYVFQGPVGRAGQSFKSLAVTSFVAGTATSGFAVLHFNRIASYGLAGNLLAMPIFTFWVMPAALAVFPALIIGREDIPLAFMGAGLDIMLFLSSWVTSWPESVVYVSSGPSWLVGVFGLAFAAICLGPRFARAAGVALIPFCLVAWASAPMADLRVSNDGAVAFWSDYGQETLYVNRKRADRYGREQFARRAGEGEFSQVIYQKNRALCDPRGCRISIKGRNVSITAFPSEVAQECLSADIVILTERDAGPVSRRNCEAMLIDGRMLARSGGQDIYFNTTDIKRKSAKPKSRSARPWGK